MPIYEFRCPRGHISEDLVHKHTSGIPCPVCRAEDPTGHFYTATRILSATRTTFKFADSKLKP